MTFAPPRPAAAAAATLAFLLATPAPWLFAGDTGKGAEAAAATATSAAAAARAAATALGTIDADETRAHVRFLAADTLEGRETGQEGCRQAAAYLADRFEEMGLTPAGDDGTWFQNYTIKSRTRSTPAANVAALLPGADPQLADQFVIVGAHYDHVGRGKGLVGGRIGGPKGEDNIWNGADDNASGTSCVLAVARALAFAPVRPRRSILFLLFSGEEKGLLGSAHYANHPIFPLDHTLAMINLDMVGRNAPGSIGVMGGATSPAFAAWIDEAARDAGMKVSTGEGFTYAQSDQFSFYQKNVPSLFFTSGLHKDYHRVSDHWDKIDADKIAKVAHVAGRVLWSAANTDEAVPFSKLSGLMGMLGGGGRPRLGVEIEEVDDETRRDTGLAADRPAVFIKRVMDGTAAAKAGLQDGDLVLSFGGKPLPAEGPDQALRERIRSAPAGAVKLTVWRSGKELELSATLR